MQTKDIKILNYYPCTDKKGHHVEFECGKIRCELYMYPDMEEIEARGDYYIFHNDKLIERKTSFSKDLYFNLCEKMAKLDEILGMEV